MEFIEPFLSIQNNAKNGSINSIFVSIERVDVFIRELQVKIAHSIIKFIEQAFLYDGAGCRESSRFDI